MGAWGTAAWEDDEAADWFADLFAATKLAQRVEKALKTKDVEEHAGKIRAAAHMLVVLGRVYIWPVEDLDRHLTLAIEKLVAIGELEDFQGDPHIAAEIAELRSRLKGSAPKAELDGATESGGG